MHPPKTKRTRRCLSGLVITSLPHSELIKTQAETLGARYTRSLTAQTTHFLTSIAGTPQHRKAQTQKTMILEPGWLEACHKGMLHVPTAGFYLPPLKGLVICCSGLDAQEKASMEALCRETGASYTRTLGRDCTHLLCDVPTGRKFEFAKSSGIRVLRSRWLRDCASGNVLHDEESFLLHPRGEGTAPTGTATATGTEVAASGVPGTQPSEQRDRAQRVLSDDGYATLLDGAVLYFPPSPVTERAKHAPLHAKAVRLAARLGATVTTTLSGLVTHIVILRSASPATLRTLTAAPARVTTLGWLEKVAETGELCEPFPHDDGQTAAREGAKTESCAFRGVRACVGALSLRDAGAARGVEAAIKAGRGVVLAHDMSGNAVHGVATHVVCAPDLREAERGVVERAREMNRLVVCVTPFWVEMCGSAGQLLPVRSCVLFAPVGCVVPVAGLAGLGVTISGFQRGREWDERREVLRRVGILLGCKYSERMTRRWTGVLVAEKDGSEKVRKAREWGIEVVRGGWLLECARRGRLVEFAGWRLGEGEDGKEAMSVLQKLSDGLRGSEGVDGERRKVRSRSVSRDEFSMDASQSQLIVHRDLTPPLSDPA